MWDSPHLCLPSLPPLSPRSILLVRSLMESIPGPKIDLAVAEFDDFDDIVDDDSDPNVPKVLRLGLIFVEVFRRPTIGRRVPSVGLPCSCAMLPELA